VNVSILSLFKCVCRIILTSYTQAKRARVHPCSRASAFSLPSSCLPLSLSPSSLSLPPPPLCLLFLSRFFLVSLTLRPTHPRALAHARARESARIQTRVRKREEAKWRSGVNQIALCARQTTPGDATLFFHARRTSGKVSHSASSPTRRLRLGAEPRAPLSHRAFRAHRLYARRFARREMASGRK